MNTREKEDQQQLTDAEIISRILCGEQRLYELLMRRYNARLYRTGMSIVNNDAMAEELMQITYIKAYEHLADFENRAKTMLRETLGNYYKSDSVYHFHLSRCDRVVNNVMNRLGISPTSQTS